MSENLAQPQAVQHAASDGVILSGQNWQAANTASTDFLLIHGLASGSRIWDLLAADLRDLTGASVTAYDQRGHGLSDKPATGYDLAQEVADAHLFVPAAKKHVVVGHSWGATVALAFAAAYPQATAAVVLVDGALGNLKDRPGATWEDISKQLAPPEFAGTPRSQFINFFKNGPQAKFIAPVWSDQLEDIMLNIVELRPDDTIAPRLSRANHMQILRTMWDTDHNELATKVTCPALLISAESSDPTSATDNFQRDWLLRKRAGAEKLQAALSNSPLAEFKIFSETIHDIPLQRPRELAETIVEFLKKAKLIS